MDLTLREKFMRVFVDILSFCPGIGRVLIKVFNIKFTFRTKLYLSEYIRAKEKGEDITVTFKPSTGYWLYEVDVNGVYVGQSKVKETMTFKDIEKKTKIEYAFSDSSRSPKTGDRSEVNLWIAEEILSFLGMTTITWYLFRRKETY